MVKYNIEIDNCNYEIFPKQIWEDTKIIFHGTSEYYSKDIEKEGFTKSYCPFSKDQANDLIALLRKLELDDLDEKQLMIKDIEKYIIDSTNNELRISFSYSSYVSSYFASGIYKGGQIIGKIAKCKKILLDKIESKEINPELITNQIAQMFQLVDNISEAYGVVYAIKIDEPYEGIQEEFGVIYSNITISPNMIIGKIILPEKYCVEDNIFKQAKKHNIKKLFTPNNLGNILYKIYNDNFEN